MKNKHLIFLIILFIIVVLYYLLSLYIKYNPAQKQLNTSFDMYSSMMDNFQIEDSIMSKRTDFINKINELNFRTKLSQEDIISVLYTCALKNGIYISDIIFVGGEDVLDEDIDIVESEQTFVFQYMGVSLEFKAELEKILEFIDDIMRYKDICATNLNVSACEGNVVFAIVNIDFYAVPAEMDF